MREQTATLTIAHGRVERPVRELLAGLVQKHAPQIIWREPVPTRRRLDGFIGLWCGDLDQFAENCPYDALDEARLFWDEEQGTAGALHLVAVIYGQANCRQTHWAAFWHADGDRAQPAWVDDNLIEKPEGDRTFVVHALEEDVLTMAERDRNRYGLRTVCHPDGVKLTVHKYFQGTELVFWRLARKDETRDER
ncbi:MAG TPA: hypothetical protein EYP56_18825 [Planctomycetaceae bacterium]|nr:hypothetical protein [Planctomycetaceae bacterium]HIQ20961.1 hypothetical protein [Planctomycetota bacterium]